MSKVLVGDLRKLKKEVCEGVEAFEYKGLNIEVKQYLPILEKIGLVSSAYMSAVGQLDELSIIDYNALEIAWKVLVIERYTNITLPKNNVEAYDLILETGIYEVVSDKIYDELNKLEKVLSNHIAEQNDTFDRTNTMTNMIKNTLDKLGNNMPDMKEVQDLIAGASKTFEGFDPEKLNFVKDFMTMEAGNDVG